MEKKANDIIIDGKPSTEVEDHGVGTTTLVYIDPAREAAVRRKFDIYVVPVSVIYLVLSTLDRNNVRNAPLCTCSFQLLNVLAWQCPSIRLR
jgi:hypothetical protein